MDDFKRFIQYVRPYWGIFAAAIVAMIFVALLETATGALLVPIFDQFSPVSIPTEPSATLFSLQNYIPRSGPASWGTIAVLLLAFTILKGIAEYFSSYLMAKIGQSAVLDLRKTLYNHLLSQPAAFFEKHRTNFLVSRLVVNCSAIELAVSANLRDVLRESFMLICFLSAAFWLNWRLMLGAIVIAPIIGFLTSKFSRALRRLSQESLEGNKLLTDTAQETLANQTIVKAYVAEEREMDRFEKVANLIARANLRAFRISAISPPIIDIIGVVSIIGLLYFGLNQISSGQMTAAQFGTFLFFIFRSYDPMRKISRQHNEISKAFAAAKDVWEVLDDNAALSESPDAVVLSPLTEKIAIENLSFSYENDGKMILDDVTLDVPRGSMVALVGESGGGKSSLIKLVQRLYDPTSGSIKWDGIDLRRCDSTSLKKQIALVTQETVLFNDTIKYNISYGNPNATDEMIAEAARIAFAADFIEELPDKYETLVGERGASLSGGQRQRIAIARAVLINAPVLILDEATSALDAESERLVQKALSNLMKGKTSIVIAHRLSTIRKANRIVVMENGKIIQAGTHQELLGKPGKYNRLYELQFADDDEKTNVI